MRLSNRVERLRESATVRVTRLAAELKAEGRDIVDLSAGQPDFPSPEVAVEAACKALRDGFTRYTAAAGTPDLREAVAEYYHQHYGSPWRQPNVLVTVGAKSALFEVVLATIQEGDRVVLPTPAWVSFAEQIRFAGGEVVEVPLSPADAFAIRAEPILDVLDENTRMVLINSPSNPTGGLVSAEDLRRIVEVCAERGILVLSDETYEHFVYGGEKHASAAVLAAEYPETVVLVGSFSKTWAMTGWRIGYCLGCEPLVRKLIALQSHSTSNPTSFAMSGALAALGGAWDEVKTMIAEFEQRRDFLVAGLEEIQGVECATPLGAFYAFPRVSDHYRDGLQGSVEMAEYLLREAGLALVPGAAFGADDHIRFSFACSRQDLARALERLKNALG
jgi:aspartate aminotransferase